MTSPPWRDRVKVHPAADLFPMMPDNELDDLAKDIAENGLQQPIVLWTPERLGKRPKEVYLLDGRNRLAAIELAFAKNAPRCAEEIENALYIGNGGARLLYGDDDPWAFVVSVNLQRRHLALKEKKDIAAELLKARPERSDRATAKLAKVSPTTLGKIRARLEQAGDVSTLDTHIDSKGRQQPATKRPREQQPSKEAQLRALPEQHVAQNNAVTPLPSPDRFRVADELVQVLSVLRDDRTRIAQFPLAKRVALTRGCLMALDVTLDDLRPIGDAP